jgi:hypothetical protein
MAQNWTAGIVAGFGKAHAKGQAMWSAMASGATKAGGAVRSHIVQPMGQAADMTEQVGQKLGGFGGIIGNIGGSFLRFMFNPLTLIVGLMALAIKRMTDLDSRAVNVSRAIGSGQQGMSQFQAITSSTVDKWHHLGVRTESVTTIIQGIGEAMRNMNMVSGQMVSQITQLSLAGGATKEEFGGALSSIMQMQQGMFRTKEEAQKASLSALRYARNLAAANGVPINQMMSQLSNISDAVASTMGSNPKALSQAVIQASSLGTTLEGVASIMNNMMNIESSIAGEMEASVLLGKNLNLEKLRAVSFAGDEAGVMRELKSLVGNQLEFERMLPVQRKAYAQALGMSVSELQRMAGFETQGEIQARKRQSANDHMVSVTTTFMEKINQVIHQIGIAFAQVMQGPMQQFKIWLTSGLPGETGLDKVKRAAQQLAGFLQQGVTMLANWAGKKSTMEAFGRVISGIGSAIKTVYGWLTQSYGKWKGWEIALAAIAAVKLGGLISTISMITMGLGGVSQGAVGAAGSLTRMVGILGSVYSGYQMLQQFKGGNTGAGLSMLAGGAVGGMLGGPMGMAVGSQLGKAAHSYFVNDAIIRPGAAPININPSDTLIAVKEARGGSSYISHKGAGLTGETPPQPITYNFDLGPVTSKLDALTSAILQGGKVILDGRAVGRANNYAATGAA